jgi:hypothetical protein
MKIRIRAEPYKHQIEAIRFALEIFGITDEKGEEYAEK